MVRNLQDIDSFGYRNTPLDVPGKERSPLAGVQKQNDRIIVLVIPSGNPIRRRMQNRKRSDGLAGAYPPNGNLLLLNTFDQFAVSRNHGITSQPKFADFEVVDHLEQTVHVVVMRVG